MTFQQFLASGLRNSFVNIEGGKVYVRRSRRVHEGQTVTCLDIASVSMAVHDKGLFGAFISEVENAAINEGSAVLIESILNPIVEGMAVRRGYVLIPNSLPPSYIRLMFPSIGSKTRAWKNQLRTTSLALKKSARRTDALLAILPGLPLDSLEELAGLCRQEVERPKTRAQREREAQRRKSEGRDGSRKKGV